MLLLLVLLLGASLALVLDVSLVLVVSLVLIHLAVLIFIILVLLLGQVLHTVASHEVQGTLALKEQVQYQLIGADCHVSTTVP